MSFESGRSAVLSIHGTEEFTLETTVFDPAAYEEAMELPAKVSGECTTFEDGKACFYAHLEGRIVCMGSKYESFGLNILLYIVVSSTECFLYWTVYVNIFLL